MIFGKTISYLWILSENLNFFKTRKNSYTGPLWITDPQYGGMTKKYGVSVSFCPKLAIFGKTAGQHLWILSEKLRIFKTRKISNTGPLYVTD
jgi:hypothetical protein